MGGRQSKPSTEALPIEVAPSVVAELVEEEQAEDSSSESKCPMHNSSDGSYSFNWRSLFQAAKVHGAGGDKPLSEEQKASAVDVSSMPTTDGCPVKHNPARSASEGCPVQHGSQHPQYNVYSQPIDKTNNMPTSNLNQLPASSQKSELSTNRVSSNIPKGGGETEASSSTWTYPSPQMFYNALVRKGKAADTNEEDIATVVALHNNMNEKTWREVVEWERQICGPDSDPKLLKFTGRPHDLSPKGYLKHYLLGHPLPYDRHDWTIIRKDGVTVRYVIDYYYDETLAREDEGSAMPKLDDRGATPSLLIDVRPALDNPQLLWHRTVTMPLAHTQGETSFEYLPLQATETLKGQVSESVQVWQNIQSSRQSQLKQEAAAVKEETPTISNDQAKEIATSFAQVLSKCQALQQKVNECDSEEECGRASMDLTMCMGQIVCSVQHDALIKTLQTEEDDIKIDAALERLTECVVQQTGQRYHANEQHPSVFQ